MKLFHVEMRHTGTQLAVTPFGMRQQPLLDVTQMYFSLTHSLLSASVAQSTVQQQGTPMLGSGGQTLLGLCK